MKYISTRDTRDNKEKVTSAYAIKTGIAPDGGLYMPESIPHLSAEHIQKLTSLSYTQRAADIIGMYLTDYTDEELSEDARNAYTEEKFPGGAARLSKSCGGIYPLELWHGPTAAFKDMALQIMPRLLVRALGKTEEKRTALILVATSGDTGKAALEGYKDISGVKIQVFYPRDGVSRVQKLQMTTQTGDNVDVCAIIGNFDDAQTAVKSIFADAGIHDELSRRNVFLSSANSINFGRLVPQIVYYVSAYCDLVSSGVLKNGETADICVPTGNFGNILAAYMAKLMGLPVGKLICASNSNNILTDFINTGIYDRNRDFHTTMSPSMDILISSNLERLLYLTAGASRTAGYMKKLGECGKYTAEEDVLSKIKNDFCAYCCTEEETSAQIAEVYQKYGYLTDTHTAVGFYAAEKYKKETCGKAPVILASTASPYKFAADVLHAVSGKTAADGLSALDELSAFTKTEISYPLRNIGERRVRFDKVIAAADMPASVIDFASR